MAISGNLEIKIGLPNESKGSDSLYTAFNKINTNFNTLFGNASKVVAGNGITVTNNLANTVIETNLIAGNNIVLTAANGAITIESIGGGGGNGGGNITGVLAGNGLTGGGYSGNVTLSLSNSNVAAGIYSNPIITVDQYGRIISASNNLVSGTVTSIAVSAGTGIQVSGSPITSNGTITVTNTGVLNLLAGSGVTLSSSNGNVTISLSGGGGGSGTVTSVGITSNTGLVISGSPIISSGNIGVNLPSNLSITGNITAGGRFIGNGSGLTGITVAAANVTGLGNVALANFDGNASNVLHGDGTWSADVTNYGNSNVAAYLPTYTGNLTAGNANVTGQLISTVATGTAPLKVTSTTQVANLNAATAGTVTTAAQPNITSVGTLASLTVTANTTTGGIKTDNYYYANGVSISFAGSYSNSNVAAYLPTYAGNITAGNVYANSGIIGAQTLKGEGGNISNVQGANVSGAVSSATTATTAGTVTTAAQPNITSTGTLTGLGVNGTITGVNITANTGVFTGNGSGLTALNASNISSGTLAQARLANSSVTLGSTALTLGATVTTVSGLTSISATTFSGALSGAATTAGTVTTAAQPNITSVGTLSSLSVTGNIGANIVLLDSYVKTEAVTFSLLPSAATAGAGARAFISDGNIAATGNFAAQVQGGGANNVPVYSDGTNWLIG